MITYIFSGFDIKEHFGKNVSEYLNRNNIKLGVTVNPDFLITNNSNDYKLIGNYINNSIKFMLKCRRNLYEKATYQPAAGIQHGTDISACRGSLCICGGDGQ